MAKNNPVLRGGPVDLYLRWGLVYGFDSLFKLRGFGGIADPVEVVGEGQGSA
jgi:hypothetical protein